MATVQNIIDRAMRPMRDAALEFFSTAELIEYINEAVEDLASRQRLEHNQTTAVVGGGLITPPSGALNIRWVQNPDGIEVTWVDPSTFKGYVIDVPELSENFPIAAMWDDVIHVHPTPVDGDTWTLGYYGLPAALTSVGDTFPLPRVWERKVVHYTRSRCYTKLGEESLSGAEMGLYQMGLRPEEASFDKNLPGTITLAREPNVFDLDPEAIHQGG